ncbi:Cation-transporting P-type ATPase domain-containing protein [Rozella allomycis CSF55]|uniref:Cation-transporting P-type ATPase domain-containing protein n=1 Tax=Rozella allomycis (strain CSF55) TaxID=988480 RepID=A0A075B2N5_ROZAC|nr:Cation-transporting P-type ATPase domain-containing protein [Rozella allomycis CSF55]|eukprot:EPZ35221.1 Cation-transporting P-type ATPase domain-containing protein [Rozella allomycis CSF55]
MRFQERNYVYGREGFASLKMPVDMKFEEYVGSEGIDRGIDRAEDYELYGENEIRVKIPKFWEMFKEHAVAPFFVFQVFSVVLWMRRFFEKGFESTVVFQRLKMKQEFSGMKNESFRVLVKRRGKWVEKESRELIPGDVIRITGREEEMKSPCDLVLVEGSVVVNEVILTGESTPMLKENILNKKGRFDITKDKENVLFGGSEIILGVGEEIKCFVLRTGYETSQGRLIRMMEFHSENVNVNSYESFMFILFLLMFAILAAYHVFVKGMEYDEKSKSKLILECLMIITAVVPPELPMELSMAVNNSLIELSKKFIYCMEPFRIPFGGKIDVCCFDKTGTLTEDKMELTEIIEYKSNSLSHFEVNSSSLKPTLKPTTSKQSTSTSTSTSKTSTSPTSPSLSLIDCVGCCNSLKKFNNKIIGDPMEVELIEKLEIDISKNKIIKRFNFNSEKKRMGVLVEINKEIYFIVKGAPEIIKSMISNNPNKPNEPLSDSTSTNTTNTNSTNTSSNSTSFDSVYEEYKRLAKQGYRIISFGFKKISKEIKNVSSFDQEYFENNLTFSGFAVFDCKLKKDTKDAINNLRNSNHFIVLITGDNILTAIHVAKELNLKGSNYIKEFKGVESGVEGVKSGDNESGEGESGDNESDGVDTTKVDTTNVDTTKVDTTTVETTTVDATTSLSPPTTSPFTYAVTGDTLNKMSPSQFDKLIDKIIVYARVSPEQKEFIITKMKEKGLFCLMCGDGTNDVGALKKSHIGVCFTMKCPSSNQVMSCKNTLIIGDASAAAPFTSKLSSIQSVCHILRQGRCTLVTTIQMYKILALNCLISAYSMTVMTLDGLRSSDFQQTFAGIILASSFLFLSQSKPLDQLSIYRPPYKIFSFYFLSSLLIQFAIHFSCLFYTVSLVKSISGQLDYNLERKFEPNLLNSSIFLLSLSMQVSTFLANYQVHLFTIYNQGQKPASNDPFINFITPPQTYNNQHDTVELLFKNAIGKCSYSPLVTLINGFLAGKYFPVNYSGIFVATGGFFSIIVGGGFDPSFSALYPAVPKVTGGFAFSLALILIVFLGGELFTGNTMVLALGLFGRRARRPRHLSQSDSSECTRLHGDRARYRVERPDGKVFGARVSRRGVCGDWVRAFDCKLVLSVARYGVSLNVVGWMYGADAEGAFVNFFVALLGNIVGGALFVAGSQYFIYKNSH